MPVLYDRICSLGQNPNSYDPVKNLPITKDYGPITMQPTVRIQIIPDGTLLYEDMTPLIAPDGGIIPATGPGTWGQLYAAGRRGLGR